MSYKVNPFFNCTLEYEMPDKYHMKYLQEGIIETLIERMKTDVEPTILMIVKTLSRLATKSK